MGEYKENTNTFLMFVEPYCFNQNYFLPFSLMLYYMHFFLAKESLHPYLLISHHILFFIINYLILIYSKSLVVFVMLQLFKTIKPNYNLDLEKQFSWVTSQVIKVILFFISIPERFSFIDMLSSMKMFFLTPQIHPLSLLIGNISLFHQFHQITLPYYY